MYVSNLRLRFSVSIISRLTTGNLDITSLRLLDRSEAGLLLTISRIFDYIPCSRLRRNITLFNVPGLCSVGRLTIVSMLGCFTLLAITRLG